MRDEETKWPKSLDELTEYIKSLTDREHDYGTRVYARSLAAAATFNYVATKLGVTGFQASCADLDFLRRTRSLKGPFIILKAEDICYPQYNLHEKLNKDMNEWKSWVAEECKKLLETSDSAHPDVIAHWKKLAAYKETK